jgi:hypothetical protein
MFYTLVLLYQIEEMSRTRGISRIKRGMGARCDGCDEVGPGSAYRALNTATVATKYVGSCLEWSWPMGASVHYGDNPDVPDQ